MIGPLPESDGNRHVLMCVDRFTHWFTATPLTRQVVQTVISCFLRDWVANYGAHLKCVTDQAKIFLSQDWQQLMSFLGTSHAKCRPYHPQANAQTERYTTRLAESVVSTPMDKTEMQCESRSCANAVERAHTNSLDANDKLIQTRPHVRNTIASRKRQVVNPLY